ncbi:septum formation initiator family protein [Streptosporangium sp. KLBMP 9127]|nr:septum formation initiator family protein [Streptosporangium sp. KLBMP 9127]
MSKRPQLTGRAAVLALVVCAIALSLAYPVREYIAQRRDIAQMKEENERERAELAKLAERSRRVTDPDYTKQSARERLFYCGPGEACFVVMDDRPKPDKAKPGQAKAARPPWYQSLWESVEAADEKVTR